MNTKPIFAILGVSLLISACASPNKDFLRQVRYGTRIFNSGKLKEEEIERMQAKKEESLRQQAEKDFMRKKLLPIEPLGVVARPISEEAAIQVSKIRYKRTGLADPLITTEQKIIYPYRLSIPRLLCAPLRISTIELEDGEKVLHVETGDSKRWYINPNIVVGREGKQKPIISIKPLGLQPMDTNLVISTNRRFYEIELKTVSVGEVGRHIAFYYPQEPGLVKPVPAKELIQHNIPGMESTLVSINDVNFDYVTKGKKRLRWFPKRVYDDGRKTYIEFDPSIEASELPIFMVFGKRGQVELVNHRLQHGRYIIDRLFDKGVLVLGAGNRKQMVTIKRKTKSSILW